ncbi:hypothetical protein BCEP27_110008 [Burkholderia cepacia]
MGRQIYPANKYIELSHPSKGITLYINFYILMPIKYLSARSFHQLRNNSPPNNTSRQNEHRTARI